MRRARAAGRTHSLRGAAAGGGGDTQLRPAAGNRSLRGGAKVVAASAVSLALAPAGVLATAGAATPSAGEAGGAAGAALASAEAAVASARQAVAGAEGAVTSLGDAVARVAQGEQTGPNFPCVARAFDPTAPPDAEGWGPTDVNAQTANGRLAAGVSRSATLTVLRWPSPSYYDQVKYYTVDRRLPLLGAKPNEGAFLGVVVGGRTLWLRDFPRSRQRYPTSRGDEVITEFSDPTRRLRVVVRDVAPRGVDALIRRVEVRASGRARPQALVAFENFNLVVSKLPAAPLLDFCNEELNNDSARYVPDADAIVHERSGVDASTGKPSSVAVAMAFARRSDGHQVGGDRLASPGGLPPGAPEDAYDDAADGRLTGSGAYTGQTTGALRVPLRLRRGRDAVELVVAAGRTRTQALAELAAARKLGERRAAAEKRRWLARLLRDMPMPRTRDQVLREMARRALTLIVTTADPRGPIVAAISTQPPYGEDWPRDGAFFDLALDRARLHELVRRHLDFYVRTQATATRQPRGSLGVPPGNWAMNYYADGVVGGPIPWEIDETGFMAWDFARHFEATRDRSWLRSVYPTVRRAADFLAACRDPLNGLQCRATEDDTFANLGNQQTIIGAAITYLGLRSAARAARALGEEADAARWEGRAAELQRAIDEHLWDPAARSYGGGVEYCAYPLWPAELAPADRSRLADHAEYCWRELEPSFRAPNSDRTFGLYESKALIALARFWRRNDPAKLARVRRGIDWIAHVEATPDTHVLGETWRVARGRVLTYTATPHLWEHTLFYLAMLETYGAER